MDAAKWMKPCIELNLSGRIGLEWVLFGFEGCGLRLREEEWRVVGAGGGMGR